MACAVETRYGRFRVRHPSLLPAVLECVRTLDRVSGSLAYIERRDCGTGAGGFKPGNKCAGGEGGGEDSGGSDSGGAADSGGGTSGGGASSPEVKSWAEKKFDNPEHAKAFVEWFGASRVVDEKGEPLLIHKGMPLKDWKTGGTIDSVESTNGPWAGFFSDDRPTADRFAQAFRFTGDTQVVSGYASIKSPYVIDAGGKPAKSVQFDRLADGPSGPRVEVAPRIREVIDSGKYDGIVIKNTSDEGNVFVPFRPEDVKSVDNAGSFDPKNKNFRRSLGNSLALSARDCGTGAGGFKPGNKCAGGGDGGGGDSGGGSEGGGGDSGGSSGSGGVEQAKAGDGPMVKAARDEHKKALEKLRKNIEAAEQKAQAKFQEKWDAHAPLKARLDDHLALVDKMSAEHESLVKQVMADPTNESLAAKMRESGQELLDERVAIEPLEKAEAKARKEREKARHEMRNAVAKTLAKEAAAVDKEDGITAAQRKRSLDAVEQTHKSGSQITSWAQEQNLPESVSLSQRESAVEARTQAQEFLRSAVNPTIHTRALEGPIEYKDGVRANAAGVAEAYESIHGGSSDASAVVGRTQLSPTDSASTVIHEFGHQIEHGNVESARLCHDFLQSRVAGEQAVSFSDKFQGYGYGSDEQGSPDDFLKAVRAVYGIKPGTEVQYAENIAHYAGKRYEGNGKTSPSGFTTYGATEVLSIGMELLAKDARAFSAADPEWFDLVSGIATGRILTKTRRQRRKG